MVRILSGILVECDAPIMMILEQINQEKQFIIYRISDVNCLVKEGSDSWLQDEVSMRLERAERGNMEELLKWKDKI